MRFSAIVQFTMLRKKNMVAPNCRGTISPSPSLPLPPSPLTPSPPPLPHTHTKHPHFQRLPATSTATFHHPSANHSEKFENRHETTHTRHRTQPHHHHLPRTHTHTHAVSSNFMKSDWCQAQQAPLPDYPQPVGFCQTVDGDIGHLVNSLARKIFDDDAFGYPERVKVPPALYNAS